MKTSKRVVILHADVVGLRAKLDASHVQLSALNNHIADLKHMLFEQAREHGRMIALIERQSGQLDRMERR